MNSNGKACTGWHSKTPYVCRFHYYTLVELSTRFSGRPLDPCLRRLIIQRPAGRGGESQNSQQRQTEPARRYVLDRQRGQIFIASALLRSPPATRARPVSRPRIPWAQQPLCDDHLHGRPPRHRHGTAGRCRRAPWGQQGRHHDGESSQDGGNDESSQDGGNDQRSTGHDAAAELPRGPARRSKQKWPARGGPFFAPDPVKSEFGCGDRI